MRGHVRVQDVIAYSAAVSACEKGRQRRQAVHLVQKVQRHAVLGVIACAAAIRACESGQQPQQVLPLLRAMWHRAFMPGVIAYDVAICACE